ncbi:hypothetical protein RvY_13476 [Ramazzottius varieornatus]|uniref:Uncharacterized protein n=1 Tax=Ramazzottius varieornatus TaxID=947166 RepID=A0A1D1VMY8_RAMVA|nr:hypothetical protein RvY_13476 [Ramazzottius varieornatus]
MPRSEKMTNVTRFTSLYGLLIVSLYSKKLPGGNAAALAGGSGRSFMPQDRHLYFSPSRNLFGTMSGDSKWASFPKKDLSALLSDPEVETNRQQKRSLEHFIDDSNSFYGLNYFGDYEMPYDYPQAQIEAPLTNMAKRFGRVQYRSEKPLSQWLHSNFSPEGDSSDILTESLQSGSFSGKHSLKPKGPNTLFKMRLFG